MLELTARIGKNAPGIIMLILIGIMATVTANAATFTVNQTGDTGDLTCDTTCTLRDAIDDANAQSAADTIVFDASVFNTPQTIVLTGGVLTVGGNVTISGTGANLLTVSGNNSSRIFRIVGGNSTLKSISGMTLTQGNGVSPGTGGNGGAIFNEGNLTITNSVVIGNSTAALGGGIANSSLNTLNVVNCTISNNIGDSDNNGSGSGGGLANPFSGIMTVTNSTITGNSLGMPSTLNGGGGIYNGGVLTIAGSTISGNSSKVSGGGIYSDSGNTLTIMNSVISNNIARSTNTGNAAGGGLWLNSSTTTTTTTITNSTFTGNSVGTLNAGGSDGGGIFVRQGAFSIANSTVGGNSAKSGGGIYVGNVGTGTKSISNTTVSGNTATTDGGGIYLTAANTLTNLTVNDNSAERDGGGIYSTGTSNVRNTLIANNRDDGTAPDVFGMLTSQGYNLIENTTGATIGGDTTGNITGVDPNLSPLRNNGGLTQTHALLPGSPAIDAGTNCVVDLSCPTNNPPVALTTDQRGAGFTRAKDSNLDGIATVDIGAFEGVVFDSLPGADTWVQGADAFRNTNYGTSPELQVKRTLNPGAGRGRRGFLRFNTSGVAGAVPSAKLRIFARLTAADIPPTVMIVQKVTDTTWNELSMTWNNQPGVASPNALAQITVSGTQGAWYEFDLTSFLQQERAAGQTAVAFRLINLQPTGITGASFTSVNSKEAATNKPLLVIEQ